MERIGGEIERELSRFGARGAMPALVAAWPEAVGAAIAANAWPARVARDGTLHVHTSSSAWAFELTQLAPTILARIVEKLGESAPTSLRFAVGHLPEPSGPPPSPMPQRQPEPSAEALHRAAELTRELGDGELASLVARAAALSLSRQRSDSPF